MVEEPTGAVDRVLRAVAALVLVALPARHVQVMFAEAEVGYDDFWHLLTGSVIAESGAVPRADLWCFTTDGFVWHNLNWLSQLIGWKVFEGFGWQGAFALSGLLIASTMVITWGNLMTRRVHPLIAVPTVLLTLWTVRHVFGLRPRMWSFALMASLVWLLAPGHDGDRRFAPWKAAALLGILWCWNQLHGGFVYGYGFVGFVAAGAAFDQLRETGSPVNPKTLWLGGAIVLGLLAFALHPHGFGALWYALTYPALFEPAYFERIVELKPLNFRTGFGAVVEVYLMLGAGALVLTKRRIRFEELLPALIFLHLALVVVRGAIPLIVITGPWLAQLWTEILEEQAGRASDVLRDVRKTLSYTPVALPASVGLVIVVALVQVAQTGAKGQRGDLQLPRHEVGYRDFGAVQFIADHPDLGDGGRIFNKYGSGGALSWVLHPQRRVFIDGRGDFHSQGNAYTEYLAITELESGWKARFDVYDTRIVMMESGAPLVEALVAQHGWQVAYEDARYTVIER